MWTSCSSCTTRRAPGCCTHNPATQTTALIQTDLPEGRYYLHVRNAAAGDPVQFHSHGLHGLRQHRPILHQRLRDRSDQRDRAAAGGSADLRSHAVRSDQPPLHGHLFRRRCRGRIHDRLERHPSHRSERLRPTRPVHFGGCHDRRHPAHGHLRGRSTRRRRMVARPQRHLHGVDAERTGGRHPGRLGGGGTTRPVQRGRAFGHLLRQHGCDPGWTLEPQWQYGTPSYSGRTHQRLHRHQDHRLQPERQLRQQPACQVRHHAADQHFR
jgi:hypothetical protein